MATPEKLSLSSTLPLPTTTTTTTSSGSSGVVQIPRLGFGTYLSSRADCAKSCLAALRAGYRHLDSAQYYENEAEMGQAVRQSGLRRSEVFMATKILVAGGSVEASYRSVLESVARIDGGGSDGDGDGEGHGGAGGGYVDLFLVHSPNAGSAARKEMWLALERLYAEGRARAIGVSNWGIAHIEEARGYAKVWPPHVNQIELHAFMQQREIVKYCQEKGIVVEAYSPIVRNQKASDPTLYKLSKAHGKTTSQILIRYCLQKGWVPLPKSDTESRIKENADIFDFELSSEDMETLDNLDQGPEGSIVEVVKNDSL